MILFLLFLFFNYTTGVDYLKEMECNEKMLFILDSSSSINNDELYGKQFAFYNFKREINYLIDSNKNIQTEHFALIQLGNEPSLVFDLIIQIEVF